MPPKEQTTSTATTGSPEELGNDRPAPNALMPLQAEIAQHEIRGHSLWEARKRVSLSRGDVGRLIGLHDKTVGEIERKIFRFRTGDAQNGTLSGIDSTRTVFPRMASDPSRAKGGASVSPTRLPKLHDPFDD